MADITALLNAFDEAVGAAVDVVEPDDLEAAAQVAKRARRRLGFSGESVVVALVGGTGSGKSSLLNALAGEQVAEVGVLRPTTQTPLAWMPAEPEPGLTRLLDTMGVDRRVGHAREAAVCILDMPDVDSVAGSHRDEVERLLPQVDLVVWVLDPEKYNDRVIHEDFLRHLAVHESQFVFVLNQIDRVYGQDESLIVNDLTRQLREDGFAAPLVMATAANPTVGAVKGIEAVWRRLVGMAQDKRLLVDKLEADVAGAAQQLEAAAGLGTDVEWDATWRAAQQSTALALADAALSGTSEAALEAAETNRALARHPFGTLGMLRRRRVGRALGMNIDPTSSMRAWTSSPAAAGARGSINAVVGSLIGRLRGVSGRRLAERFDDDWVGVQVDAVMDRVIRSTELPEPTRSGAGWVGWLGVLALVIGVAWWATVPPARGEFPWHLVLVGGGAALVLASRSVIRAVARRRAKRTVVALRSSMEADAAAQLDTLVGRPLREELRHRAELRAALAAVSMLAPSTKESR